MRRLFVVVSVLSALAVPLAPSPAEAAPTAAVCLYTSGTEGYFGGLPPVTGVPTTLNVALNIPVGCTGVAPATFSMTGGGTTTGTCAAEAGTATVSTGFGSGTMAWARVGIHQVNVVYLGTYVWEIHGGWLPNNILDCVSVGVGSATILAYGPLVGV